MLKDVIPSWDWDGLRNELPEVAGRKLGDILRVLDTVEAKVFAARGMAAILIEERQLYRFVVDEEVGDYFQSFDRYLKVTAPNSWSYVREAMRSLKRVKEVPVEDLVQMKRCNIEQLGQASSSVRVLPEVIKAAKTLPEKALVETLNRDHGQHLEQHKPLLMAPAGDVDEFERAVEMVTVVEECHSRAEALKAIGIRIIEEYASEYEHRKDATA